MSLALLTKPDVQMYSALEQLPRELDGKFLSVTEFRTHFKSFYGRPVQDIIEALHRYSQQGYFKYEIMLAPEYLQRGRALAKVTDALNELRGIAPDAYSGLGAQVHAKVVAERPLTKAEASNLPDDAKEYLRFRMLDIDRYKLGEELKSHENSPALLEKFVDRPKPTIDPNKLKVLPSSYDKANHVLTLSGIPHPIMKQENRKNETKEAKLMAMLFSVKYFQNGVGLSRIYSVKDYKNKRPQTKKARLLVTAINKKLPGVLKGQELIKFDGLRFYINPQYKKN